MTAKPKTAQPTEQPAHSQAVLDGPILSSRQGDVTTIWRDGEVLREDRFGRVKRLDNAKAITP